MLWKLIQRLHARLPLALRQRWCGWVYPGHHYTVEMIRDEGMFIVDPLASCTTCELPLPQAQYDRLTAEIVELTEEEDEVW